VAVTWGAGLAEVVPEGCVVGVAVAVEQADRVIVFVSRVTAPLRARTRPSTVAPVCRLMLVRARIVPTNLEPVPSVALLPTCQNT
jgi:hypothetical protein